MRSWQRGMPRRQAQGGMLTLSMVTRRVEQWWLFLQGLAVLRLTSSDLAVLDDDRAHLLFSVWYGDQDGKGMVGLVFDCE